MDAVAPDWLSVAPVTVDRLAELVALVTKWTPAINLVSKSTLPDIWHRHVYDSAQIYDLAPRTARHWVDLGSGAGFPGLVVAILAKDDAPDLRVTLIESDQRKATFLMQAIRQLDLSATVVARRIETLQPQGADILSARALGSLTDLCGHAQRHLSVGGVALFSKGAQAEEEIQQARTTWNFDLHRHQSKTDASATILAVKDVTHV